MDRINSEPRNSHPFEVRKNKTGKGERNNVYKTTAWVVQTVHRIIIIVITNIKDWTLWSDPFRLQSYNCFLQRFFGLLIGIGPKGYYRCRQIISTNLGKHHPTWHRTAVPENPTSSRPRSWSLGNATLVVAQRSGWRRVLGASNPRPSAKRAHPTENGHVWRPWG